MKKQAVFMIFALTSGLIHAQSVRTSYIVIDQIGGKKAKTPEWAEKNLPMSALEEMNPGRYAFVVRKNGSELPFLESWVNKVQVASVVARQISQNITEITDAQEESGAGGNFRQTMSSLSKNISKVRLTGLRREQEWWILKEFRDKERKGQREYSYSALYLVDKNLIDRMIAAEAEKILANENSDTSRQVQQALSKIYEHEINQDVAEIQ